MGWRVVLLRNAKEFMQQIFFWILLGKANIQNRRQSMLKLILRRL